MPASIAAIMFAIVIPLVIAAVGVLCSIIGTFLVKTKECAPPTERQRAWRWSRRWRFVRLCRLNIEDEACYVPLGRYVEATQIVLTAGGNDRLDLFATAVDDALHAVRGGEQRFFVLQADHTDADGRWQINNKNLLIAITI